MPSADTLKPVEPNDKQLLYIPHQNMDIDNIIRDAPGRIILTTPSSAITQIKSVISAAVGTNKEVLLVGQAIKRGVKWTLSGWDSAPSPSIVKNISKSRQSSNENSIIMVSGSNGESTSVLAQIASGTHPGIQIMLDDTILIVTTLTPDKIGPVEMMANKLINLNAATTIYHSLPVPPPLPKVRKERTFLKFKKKRSSSKKTKTKGISPRKVVRMTYAELRPVLERRASDKTKPNRLSPEGPYGSWGLDIPPEER